MITAYGDETTRKRATQLGAAGLLPKPIDFSVLRREIDHRLEQGPLLASVAPGDVG